MNCSGTRDRKANAAGSFAAQRLGHREAVDEDRTAVALGVGLQAVEEVDADLAVAEAFVGVRRLLIGRRRADVAPGAPVVRRGRADVEELAVVGAPDRPEKLRALEEPTRPERAAAEQHQAMHQEMLEDLQAALRRREIGSGERGKGGRRRAIPEPHRRPPGRPGRLGDAVPTQPRQIVTGLAAVVRPGDRQLPVAHLPIADRRRLGILGQQKGPVGGLIRAAHGRKEAAVAEPDVGKAADMAVRPTDLQDALGLRDGDRGCRLGGGLCSP